MSEVLPAGYKLTEVGVIPEDWEVRRFGEVSWVNQGLQIAIEQRFKLSTPKAKPYITIQFLNDRKNIEYIEEYPPSACCTKDDILMTRTGNTGIVVTGVDGVFHNNFFKINFEKRVLDKDYLVSFLNLPKTHKTILAKAGTSTIPDLNHGDFYSIELPVPPLPEQRAIAAALSDIDTLLAKLDTLIAKKRNIKQATMQQLLTGQTRLPGFSGEWEVKRLGDVAKITRGASPRPIDNPIWFDETSSVGWVRISDVTKSGMFLRETTQHLSLLGIKSSRPVNHGSLIMSICATVGRPVITELETCIHDGFVAFDKLLVNQTYLYYALKFIEDDWGKHGQTGSQMNLNTALINRTVISVPKSADEQTAIATVLSDMDTELTNLESRRDKTQALKQGMMQELLTGRIRLV
jgi:type I restriction enzyme, S subunit